MLVSEIIQSSPAVLRFNDQVKDAVELMQEYSVEHLPVLNNDSYEGLLSLDDLLSAGNTDTIASLSNKFIHIHIASGQHFFFALKLMHDSGITVLPVLNDTEYSGVITGKALLQYLATFLNVEIPGGIFVLEMPKEKYSIGELSRLIETNDAYITQLNTSIEKTTGLLIVTLKINKTEVSDILATLQRFEYKIRYYFGEEQYENGLKENFENLMAYLNV